MIPPSQSYALCSYYELKAPSICCAGATQWEKTGSRWWGAGAGGAGVIDYKN